MLLVTSASCSPRWIAHGDPFGSAADVTERRMLQVEAWKMHFEELCHPCVVSLDSCSCQESKNLIMKEQGSVSEQYDLLNILHIH